MYSRFLLVIVSLLPVVMAAGCDTMSDHPAVAENEQLLQRLDSIIGDYRNLVERKEIRIDGLRNTLQGLRSDHDRMGVTRQLYYEYIVYDSDSALYYATTTRKLAEATSPEDYGLTAEWKMNEAAIYVMQGMYDEAMALLVGIDSGRLDREAKSRYFGQLAYAYSMRGLYVHSNHEKWKDDISRANEYRDSIGKLNLAANPDWLWVTVASAVDTDDKDISNLDITALKRHVDQTGTPSRNNAINAYWLARYYEAAGDEVMMVRYMTMAAIYDALIVNREIAASQELATWLFDHGELNRAYNYLLYAVNQANLFKNRYRMVALSDVLPMVRDAYRAEVEKRDRSLLAMVVALTILTCVLIASIVIIIIEYRKLRKTRNLLTHTNRELSEALAERDNAIGSLKVSNRELTEANKQKLGVLAYAFRLTTEYINALEDYRKKLLKKYKVKKIDDLGVLINDPELIKEQYQGFYESFDKTALSIFPDFVADYNATVDDSDKVSPESVAKSGTLNTKLRIHALRRLGVTKSADIARMLNLSIRTVYNNRTGAQHTDDEA